MKPSILLDPSVTSTRLDGVLHADDPLARIRGEKISTVTDFRACALVFAQGFNELLSKSLDPKFNLTQALIRFKHLTDCTTPVLNISKECFECACCGKLYMKDDHLESVAEQCAKLQLPLKKAQVLCKSCHGVQYNFNVFVAADQGLSSIIPVALSPGQAMEEFKDESLPATYGIFLAADNNMYVSQNVPFSEYISRSDLLQGYCIFHARPIRPSDKHVEKNTKVFGALATTYEEAIYLSLGFLEAFKPSILKKHVTPDNSCPDETGEQIVYNLFPVQRLIYTLLSAADLAIPDVTMLPFNFQMKDEKQCTFLATTPNCDYLYNSNHAETGFYKHLASLLVDLVGSIASWYIGLTTPLGGDDEEHHDALLWDIILAKDGTAKWAPSNFFTIFDTEDKARQSSISRILVLVGMAVDNPAWTESIEAHTKAERALGKKLRAILRTNRKDVDSLVVALQKFVAAAPAAAEPVTKKHRVQQKDEDEESSLEMEEESE
jgi:hypothetical protein